MRKTSGEKVNTSGVGKSLNRLLFDLRADKTSIFYAIVALLSLAFVVYYSFVYNRATPLMTKDEWKSSIPKLDNLGPELQNGRRFQVLDFDTAPPGINSVSAPLSSPSYDHGWNTRSSRPVTPITNILPGRGIFQVVETFPHDSSAFTQGLAFFDGKLFESTGLHRASQLREVDIATGAVTRRVALPASHFGEGMVVVDGKAYVLTWQSGVVHVFDVQTFRRTGELRLPTEGWGLTLDGETGELIVSDGSHRLTWYDRTSMQATRSVDVRMLTPVSTPDNVGAATGEPVYAWQQVVNLNELEYVHPYVYAHRWHEDNVYVIDPGNGVVVHVIDGAHLWPSGTRRHAEASFNGIAVDYSLVRSGAGATAGSSSLNEGVMMDGNGRSYHMYVTGKLWPVMARVYVRWLQEPTEK